MFENRKYVIIPTADINMVNFDEVLETSAETCRYSVDGEQTFVKYDGAMPPSLLEIQNRSDEYNHSEILEILSGTDWSEQIEEE